MYSKILLNNNLSSKKKVKNIISYFLMRRGARLAWENMFRQFYTSAPENFNPSTKNEENAHVQYRQYYSK
jgi:hypothetical protein